MKKAKLISILTTTLMVMFALTTVVAAQKTQIGPINVLINDATPNEVTDLGGRIIGIMRVVGTLVAVVMVIVLGIKYMTGSAEEKAANKKSMLPYLIGAGILFFAVNIVNAIYNWTVGK